MRSGAGKGLCVGPVRSSANHFHCHCHQDSPASHISISRMRKLRSRGDFPMGKAGEGLLGELVPLGCPCRQLTVDLGTELVLQLPGSLSLTLKNAPSVTRALTGRTVPTSLLPGGGSDAQRGRALHRPRATGRPCTSPTHPSVRSLPGPAGRPEQHRQTRPCSQGRPKQQNRKRTRRMQ